jgi:fucose permease
MKLNDVRLWAIAIFYGFVADRLRDIPFMFSLCVACLIMVIYYFLFVRK